MYKNNQHDSYRYLLLKFEDFSIAYIGFSGVVQRIETPRAPFFSFTPAAILDRCRCEAEKKGDGEEV